MVRKLALKTYRYIVSAEAGRWTPVPAAIVIMLLLVLPGLYVFWMSVNDSTKGTVTLAAFKFLFQDDRFAKSLRVSLYYAIFATAFQTVLGLTAAALVHRAQRFVKTLTLSFFLPYAIPSVVAVITWRFLLEDRGALAALLEKTAGIPAVYWMGKGVFLTLLFVSIWQFYPFVFVTLLARMRRIPRGLYETAQIDGANALQQFRYVTFPQVRSTLIVISILRFAFMFTKFDTPWLLGGKAATNSTIATLPIYIYDHGFSTTPSLSTGVAGASFMAVIMIFTFVVGGVLFYRYHQAALSDETQ